MLKASVFKQTQAAPTKPFNQDSEHDLALPLLSSPCVSRVRLQALKVHEAAARIRHAGIWMKHRWQRRTADSFPVKEKDSGSAMMFSWDLDKEEKSPNSHGDTRIWLIDSLPLSKKLLLPSSASAVEATPTSPLPAPYTAGVWSFPDLPR